MSFSEATLVPDEPNSAAAAENGNPGSAMTEPGLPQEPSSRSLGSGPRPTPRGKPDPSILPSHGTAVGSVSDIEASETALVSCSAAIK